MKRNFLLLLLSLFGVAPLGFSLNDEPCTATPITVVAACTYLPFNSAGATASAGITAPGCSLYSGSDVWFSCVIPASGGVVIDTQTGTITDGGMAVYTGSVCSALTLLSCDDDSSPNGYMPMITTKGLTPGSTIWIRFFKYGGGTGTFSMCITAVPLPPANDNCAGAYPVSVGTTCTSVTGSLGGATQTLAGCSGNANDDVWFSFIATQASLNLSVTPGTYCDPVVQIFSGGCASLTSVVCDDTSFPIGANGLINIPALTVGQTYYYRVYDAGSAAVPPVSYSFTTCVTIPPPPPANDDCTGSTLLTVGSSCTPVSSSVYGATQSLTGCTGTANDDVWFSFVATQISQTITVTPVAGFDPVVELFSGTCSSLTSMNCNNVSYQTGAAGSFTFSGMTVGQTYYYRVYQYSSSYPTSTNSSFTTCVTVPATPPANDNCNGAIALTSGTSCVSTAGTFYGSTQSMPSNCGGITNTYDVWYSFTAVDAYENFSLTLPAAQTVYAELFSGSCGSLTSMSCQSMSFSTSPSTTFDGLTVGQTYYIRIYASSSLFPSATSTFTACMTTPGAPTNQDCLGAIPICSNVYSTTTTYSGVGNIQNEINGTISCLGTGEKNDVWYTFTVINSGNLSFTITPNVLTEDYDWAVFNLTNANCWDINNNPGLQVSCNFSGNTGATGANGITGYQNNPVIPVVAGQTYVINVSQFSSTPNGYTINFSASTASIFDNVAPVFQSISTPACGLNTVTANFSENVLCSTVSTADFTVTGPDGNHTVTAINGIGCSTGGSMENTYTLTFSPALTVAGTYTVSLVNTAGSVTDLCGNVALPASFNFTITVPVATASTTQNVLCNGGATGSTSCAVVGGTSPYTYSWGATLGTGTTSAAYSGLTAGNYIVTVTDANGCSSTASTTVTEPPVLAVSVTSIQPTCTTLGSIAATVTGGVTSYTYAWSPSGGSSAAASNLSAGTYSLLVTDQNGCTVSNSTTLTNTSTVTSAIQPMVSQCLDGNVFSCALGASASTGGTVTYTWDFGDGSPTSSSSNSTHTYLNPGTYTITLTVVDGICSATSTQTITVFAMPIAAATTNTPCVGQALTLLGAPNGMSNYSWTGPSSSMLQNPTIASSALTDAGTYTLTVTDGNGCQNSKH